MNRRRFLASASVLATVPLQAADRPAQLFPAGIVPSGFRPAAGGPTVESFWQTCDECSRLGVHNIEMNNTHRKFVDAYEGRSS